MAYVMRQGKRFNQMDVQAELGGNGPGNLRHFERVRQAIAKVVGITAGENLGFGFESPEGPRVNDAVAVPLKIISVRMSWLGVSPAPGLLHVDGIRSQRKTHCN